MRDFINDRFRTIKQHQHYDKAFHWAKLISVTGGAQIIIQGLGLVTGILVIRLLPTREYAYYTIANAMLGTMTVLADGGISTGVMAEGGKVWNDKIKLGAVLNTGLFLRKKFALYSLLVTLPILGFMLFNQNATLLSVVFIILAIIPAFWAAISDSLLETILKLHQAIMPLQKNQTSVSVLRLLLSGVLTFFFPFTAITLLGNGVPRVIGNIKLKKEVSKYANENASKDIDVEKSILNIVRKTLPGSIFFCISAQLTLWLLSLFGNMNSIASLGALARLSVLLNIFTVVFSTIFIPRFAKLSKSYTILVKALIKFLFVAALVCAGVILAVWLFSDLILSVLGKQYVNLDFELLLCIVVGCINMISGLFFTLASSRGWIINPVFLIVSNISTFLIGAFLFNISTLYGVLLFQLFTSIISISINGVFLVKKIFEIKNHEDQ